ncbi:MAG TPA: VOC family protein [Trinickia sp.]|jgi:uncharacterized glyoxalase superfamily protein PhnB|uniref:VOC family protein n=1 Tax=Trinickia sp. TaxID=2571163 RepID=UPI002BDBFE1D|nr:VOC family protein [Trinickia sp.]HVW50397.1 VOC family protein [Trinickia sp.]
MTSSVKPIPEGMHTITPQIVCANAAQAIEFYAKAFGAIELFRMPGPSGKLAHAQIKIGDSVLMLTDESPECGSSGPKTLKGTPVSLYVYVEDADKAFERAVSAGATVMMPLADMFWGDRWALVEDPYGHRWHIATRKSEPTMEQMQKAMAEMPAPQS